MWRWGAASQDGGAQSEATPDSPNGRPELLLHGDEELYLGSSCRAGIPSFARRFSVPAISLINSGPPQPSTKGGGNNITPLLPPLSPVTHSSLISRPAHHSLPLRPSRSGGGAQADTPAHDAPLPSTPSRSPLPLQVAAPGAGGDTDSDDTDADAFHQEVGRTQLLRSQSTPLGDPDYSGPALVGWVSRGSPNGSAAVSPQGALYSTGHSSMFANMLRLKDSLAHNAILSASSAEKSASQITQLKAPSSPSTSPFPSGGSTPGPGSPLFAGSVGVPGSTIYHGSPMSPLAFMRSHSSGLETTPRVPLDSMGGKKVGVSSPGASKVTMHSLSRQQQQQVRTPLPASPTKGASAAAPPAGGHMPSVTGAITNGQVPTTNRTRRRASSFSRSAKPTPSLLSLLPRSEELVREEKTMADSEQAATALRSSCTHLPRPQRRPSEQAYPSGPTTEYISAAAIATGFVIGRDTQPQRFVSFLERPRPPPQRDIMGEAGEFF